MVPWPSVAIGGRSTAFNSHDVHSAIPPVASSRSPCGDADRVGGRRSDARHGFPAGFVPPADAALHRWSRAVLAPDHDVIKGGSGVLRSGSAASVLLHP